jgi:hypothetical protein
MAPVLDDQAAMTGPPIGEDVSGYSLGESRWPPALALLAFMVLNVAVRQALPGEQLVRVPYLVPAVEAVLLVFLLASGSDRLGRHVRRVRLASVSLVCILDLAALWATGLLVYDLINGSEVTESPGKLLAIGAVVWLGNNLSFALLYWLMDGGGPHARIRRVTPGDFAFTQQLSPELAPPGWRPVFLDYLHLGFTNATAFSPTDVMPLTHRAKYTMLVQATVALALFGLIVARAVNSFT